MQDAFLRELVQWVVGLLIMGIVAPTVGMLATYLPTPIRTALQSYVFSRDMAALNDALLNKAKDLAVDYVKGHIPKSEAIATIRNYAEYTKVDLLDKLEPKPGVLDTLAGARLEDAAALVTATIKVVNGSNPTGLATPLRTR